MVVVVWVVVTVFGAPRRRARREGLLRVVVVRAILMDGEDVMLCF